jgi:molybdate transport system substrate-binding protein
MVLIHGMLFAASLARAETITVYAAASTIDIMTEVTHRFTGDTGHLVHLSVAASSALARQIEAGAPADIYLSANVRWMDYLAERDLIESGTRRNLLRNGLVLIVPADGAAGDAPVLDSSYPFSDLIGDGRLALADPDHVPAGIYGKQALETLGVWPVLRDRLARAQNVRAALVLVARGEVPAGIVYPTDALATDEVRVVGRFPDGSHDAIVYPIAIVKGRRTPAADAFLAYLSGPDSRKIFRRYGFDRPAE